LNNGIAEYLKYKDLGKFGKSIGNITLYNGMYLELCDETWNNEGLRNATLKVIHNHIQTVKKQEKQLEELALRERLHQGMQIFNIKNTPQPLLITKRSRKECLVCHKSYKNNRSLNAHQYHSHKKRWETTDHSKGSGDKV